MFIHTDTAIDTDNILVHFKCWEGERDPATLVPTTLKTTP